MSRAWPSALADAAGGHPPVRDHLFISYAWEDGALAEWLALRLTAEGYYVWCDRFKLLGGESWPKDIDLAIRNRAFRLLQLVSKHSLDKDNPVKERQLALALQKERGEELYVPLNADGTRPSDLNWQISDIVFIPFEDWGAGLVQLLKKLDKIKAPRPLGDAGRRIAASALLPPNVLIRQPETVYSNWFPFSAIPPAIQRFTVKPEDADTVASELLATWAFRRVADTTFLALTKPPTAAPCSNLLRGAGGVSWADVEEIDGLRTSDVLFELLNKALLRRCHARQLRQADRGDAFYFPPGLLPRDRLSFAVHSGGRSWIRVCGRRRSGTAFFRYNLGFEIQARRGVGLEPVAQLKLRIHVTDDSGQPVSARSAFRRGGRVRRGWWNRPQLLRHSAIMEHLAGGHAQVALWDDPDTEFALSRSPLVYEIDARIDEASPALAGDDDELAAAEMIEGGDLTEPTDDSEGA